jgi:hypothetical protein
MTPSSSSASISASHPSSLQAATAHSRDSAQPRTVEDQRQDLSPKDKELAYGILRAAFTFTAASDGE